MTDPGSALQELSSWASLLQLPDVPAAVARRARYVVVDTLGAALAGSAHPLTRKLGDLARSQPDSPYRLIGENRRVSMFDALIVNGCAAQVHDLDETNLISQTHAAAAILPALVTMSGDRPISGADFLMAFVVAYEVQSAIGRAMAPKHGSFGWHPSATLGCFGASAAIARLLRLDAAAFANAMNLAGMQAAGVKAAFGSMAKPIHFGKAALNGALAAIWAEAGISGGEDTFVHPLGFAHVSSGGLSAPIEVGTQWALLVNNFKTFPCCMECHPAIQAALALRRLVQDAISVVRVRQSATAFGMVGERGFATGFQAKFSLRYCLAYALAFGDLPLDAFDEVIVASPLVSALLTAIEIVPDRGLRHLEAEVVVTTQSGKLLRETVDLTAGPDLSEESAGAIDDKFVRLANPTIGTSRSLQILARFGDLTAVADMVSILDLTARVSPLASEHTEARS
jgi:2-methylcitrate dehydratase PrpD